MVCGTRSSLTRHHEYRRHHRLQPRRPPRTLAKEIALDGGQALAVTVDLTDETSVQSVAERIGHAYGRVDLVVNAAGVTLPNPVEAGRTDELVVLSRELVT